MFRHEQISTSSPLEDQEENECSWLLRSDETDSYDVIEVATEGHWSVWTGQIDRESSISIDCNECNNNVDCNYHGEVSTIRC